MEVKCLNLEYDVVLSFAGEDRKYVQSTAEFLRDGGVKVFYDLYEDTNLWGKDLYQHLDNVYQNKAKYAVVFISEAYARKLWTSHELKSAQARAFADSEEYILPVRFDDTEIPGIRRTLGYIDLRAITPQDLANKIIQKLGDIEPENFLPKEPKFVRDGLKALYEDLDDEEIDKHVIHVFLLLQKTNQRERSLLLSFILNSCRHDITKDIHEDVSLIERNSGFKKDEIVEILKGLFNLGFEFKIKKSRVGSKRSENKILYEELSMKLVSRRIDLALENLTSVMVLMCIGATKGMCSTCSIKTLNKLNFSSLKRDADPENIEEILPF